MLYRCRWCEKAFCEDCMPFEKARLLGDSLKEYELLDFPAVTQAFYVDCHVCVEYHADPFHQAEKAFCAERAAHYDEEYEKKFGPEHIAQAIQRPSSASGSVQELTDAATVSTSGVSTPQLVTQEIPSISGFKRRVRESGAMTPSKRQRQIL